jgi:hypothetical protein
MANELRKNHFLADHEFLTHLRIPTMRRTLQRQLENQILLLLGSISLPGSCPTPRESLRNIQACFRGARQKLYHMGIRGHISRNAVAHANQVRD